MATCSRLLVHALCTHYTHALQLPSVVCSFQQLNYTLIIEDESGQMVMQRGPEQQQGRSVAILVPLMIPGGRRYSVKVQVGLHSQSVTSNKHYFSKLATK